MSSSILGIGQSALAAAQAGLVTTGHNIANASTPGYSRQVVIQGSAGSQNSGIGYLGKGTQVIDVRRVYNELLASQMQSAQATASHAQTYYTQVSRINNMFGDVTAGLSGVLQEFFNGVQDLASNPNLAASRQSALSGAEALAARFRSMESQLKEQEQSVNRQIQSSIELVNSYAQQLAKLNDAIEKANGNAGGKASNDLLDQRDLLVSELSKEIKTTVVKQGNSYNVFIGNGQPLVVGTKSYNLVPTPAADDPTRITVGFMSNGTVVPIGESSLTGGNLGGLLEFRSNTLDAAQNSLGRIAIVLAETFNAQHRLGQDQNGDLGGDFFRAGSPTVHANSRNTSAPPAQLGATITDASSLTTSNYLVETLSAADPDADPPVPGSYRITRLSDGAVTNFDSFPQTVDGVEFEFTAGNPAAGDSFLVKPTAAGATGFSVAITDVKQIAAAAPIRTQSGVDNAGNGTISAGVVNALNDDLQVPVTITFTSETAYTVTRTDVDPPVVLGTGDTSAPGGSTVSYNGWTVELSGKPAAGDTFTIEPNTNGVGDNRNAVLLGALQTANTTANGTTSFQGAYAQLVSAVGNKTREVEVASKAAASFLEQAKSAQEAESGVNLDEEATNLLRYQQAYQAASKMMQTASQLFELLLTLGD